MRLTLHYINFEGVIPAKAGIQLKNTGFRVKPGMTIKGKGFMTHYTSTSHAWFDDLTGWVIERDVIFNENLNLWSWDTLGSPVAGQQMDVESIALPELGHWLNIRDLYGDVGDNEYDIRKVIYGLVDDMFDNGTTKRTLHPDDIAGIRWIYGLSSLRAVIWDTWWSNPVDNDGDGYKRSARLNWIPDVSGGSGSLTVYEKIYWKPKNTSIWNLLATTTTHTITDTVTTDSQYRDIEGGNHDEYDWKIGIYRSGTPSPDYTRDPSNDTDLDDYKMETQEQDVLPDFVTNTDSVTVPEGGTATFQVRLSAQPASNVVASVTRFSGDSDINVQSGSSLTFTISNWNTYQTVTLSTAEDVDTTNGAATIRISASGLSNKDVTATESDNDVDTPPPPPTNLRIVDGGNIRLA